MQIREVATAANDYVTTLARWPGTWRFAGLLSAYFAGVLAGYLGDVKGWGLLGVMLMFGGLVWSSHVVISVYAELVAHPLKLEYNDLLTEKWALERKVEAGKTAMIDVDSSWQTYAAELERSNDLKQDQIDEALRMVDELRTGADQTTAQASLTTKPTNPFS